MTMLRNYFMLLNKLVDNSQLYSWQVSLDFLLICADFAQFLCSFSTLRNFAQIFAVTKIFVQEINFRQRQNFSVWPTYSNLSLAMQTYPDIGLLIKSVGTCMFWICILEMVAGKGLPP